MFDTATRKHLNPSSGSLNWLLHSSGRFTTDHSKLFLETTVVPIDFLEICVKYFLYRNRNRHKRSNSSPNAANHDKYQMIPLAVKRLSQRTKSDLLRLVRNERSHNEEIETKLSILRASVNEERKVICRSRWAACVMARNGIGPGEWNSLLMANSDCDGVGVCPTTNCHVLYFKYGGCSTVVCSCCGMDFCHRDSMLNIEVIRSGKSTKQEHTKHQISEFVFRKQLLATAEKILVNSLQADKKNKQKPSLNYENHEDIIESVQYCNYYNRCHRPRPRIEEESDALDTIVENDALAEGSESDSFSQFERVGDEFSFSVYTTATTPSNYNSASLCDYIMVSELDEKEECGDSSPSYIQEVNREDGEECSFSLLSGCETVYSLNDDDDDTDSSFVGARAELGMVLSYCNATKQGNSVSENANKPPKEQTAIEWKEQKNGTNYYCCTKSHDCSENKRNNKDASYNTSNYYSEDYDIWYPYSYSDDLFCSLFNAAKSCHGGRISSRFRGNSRTIPSWNGWGKHRRPNWTRKRRKDYKKRYL